MMRWIKKYWLAACVGILMGCPSGWVAGLILVKLTRLEPLAVEVAPLKHTELPQGWRLEYNATLTWWRAVDKDGVGLVPTSTRQAAIDSAWELTEYLSAQQSWKTVDAKTGEKP